MHALIVMRGKKIGYGVRVSGVGACVEARTLRAGPANQACSVVRGAGGDAQERGVGRLPRREIKSRFRDVDDDDDDDDDDAGSWDGSDRGVRIGRHGCMVRRAGAGTAPLEAWLARARREGEKHGVVVSSFSCGRSD